MPASGRHMRNSRRHPFVLNGDDTFIITGLVNFLQAIPSTFIRSQTRSIIEAMLRVMVHVPEAARYLNESHPMGLVLFSGILNLAAEVRRESTEDRRNAYLKTVFNTMDDWMHPSYPHFHCE